GHRIERPQVANGALPNDAADAMDHVVRGQAWGLIEDEDAVGGCGRGIPEQLNHCRIFLRRGSESTISMTRWSDDSFPCFQFAMISRVSANHSSRISSSC